MTVRDLIILGSSSQQPTRERNQSGYLFRWNDEGLLFDPGEGTQRQFIFAGIAPTCITRILISHFHGDHCLGLGSMLMRLNLDKVEHPIHCYYPASGKKYFDRLRWGTAYHEIIEVIEHPVSEPGVVHDDGQFKIEALFLDHGIDCLGWRIQESDTRKFHKDLLNQHKIFGPMVKDLEKQGTIKIQDQTVSLDDVSTIRKGESIAFVTDTRPCPEALQIAKAARILISESTYLEKEKDLAFHYHHMTAKQAAQIAKEAEVEELILTHFSARYLSLQPFLDEARAVFANTFVAEDLKIFPFPKKKGVVA